MKKTLALILSLLMLVTACIGVATVSAAETAPVVLIDGAGLNTGDSYCLSGTYSYLGGFIRYTWFDQGGQGCDPQLWFHKSEWGLKTIAPWMVIKYRTETPGLTGNAFVGNGTIGQSNATWNYSVSDGSWATVMVFLPDYLNKYYDENTNQITHFRWDVVENATDHMTGYLDVEYVAFFDSEDAANDFKHENMPVDPDTAAGGSYATYDFTTATNLNMLRREGSVIGNQMTASLVDGALRITSTGDDPWVVLMNKNSDGTDNLGISGLQARYILVKYKTTAVKAGGAPMQIEFFSNVPGVAGWGNPGSYINGGNLNSDGNWHYIMIDATSAWGLHNVGLQAFRMDALASCASGDFIDIASVKFFTTSDWINTYIVGLAETDAAANEMALNYGWIKNDDTETDPVAPAVMLGDVTGDEIVNTKDLTRLKKFLASDGDGSVVLDVPAAGDVTSDEIVNTKDLTRLKKFLASDGDGSVVLG